MIVVNTAIVQGNDDEEIDIVNVSDGEVESIPFEPIVITKDPVQLENKSRSGSVDKKNSLAEDFFSSEDEIESLIQDFREREYWEKEEQKQYWLNYEKKKQAAVQEWLLHPRKMKRSLKDSKEYKIFINSNIYEPVPDEIWSKAEVSTPHVIRRSVLETPCYRELSHLVSYDEKVTKKFMDDYERGYIKCDWKEPEVNIIRNFRKRKRGAGSSSEKNDKESLSDSPNSPKVIAKQGPFTKRRRTRTPLPEFPTQEKRDEGSLKGKKLLLLSPTTSPLISLEKRNLVLDSETDDEEESEENDICEDEDWAKYVGFNFEPNHWFDEEKELCKEFSFASAPSWSTISDNLARRKSPLDVRLFFEQFISSFMYCPQHAPIPHAKSSNDQPESPNCAPQLEPEELTNTRGMRRRFFQDDAQVKLFKNSLHPQFSQLVDMLSDGMAKRARGRPPKKSPDDSNKKNRLLENLTKESLISRCKKCPKTKSLLETLLSLSFHEADLLKINVVSIFQRQVPSIDYSPKNVRVFFDSLLIAVDMCVDKKLANDRTPELPENISNLLQQFLNGFSYCLTAKDAIKLCLARQELLNACRLFLRVKTQEIGQEYSKLMLTIIPLEEFLLKMRKYVEELKTFRVTLLEQASERFGNFKQSLVDKKNQREQKS